MTLGEALVLLTATTGHRWKQYEFFYLVTHCGLRLHATAPRDARTLIHQLESHKEAKSMAGVAHVGLAVIFPQQIRELWTAGSTQTEHPARFDHGQSTMEWFTEPVTVTLESVRILHSTLKEIIDLWKAVHNRTVGISDVPKWMWLVVHKTRESAGFADRMASAKERATLRREALIRPPRSAVEASQPYVGPAPSTLALKPRILWLMEHYFETRSSWFTSTTRVVRKSDLKRQIFIRLANDGTRGERRARVSEATIHKLTLEWALPRFDAPGPANQNAVNGKVHIAQDAPQLEKES